MLAFYSQYIFEWNFDIFLENSLQKKANIWLNFSISEKCQKFIAYKMLEIKSQNLTWVEP